MASGVFSLNLNEQFTRLERPPIVEAIIRWQARAQKPLDSQTLDSALAQRLPGYPAREPMQLNEFRATVSGDQSDASSHVSHKSRWQGLRLRSANDQNVIQFSRDGLVFSRVRGYDGWDAFLEGALEAWESYLEIAQPLETTQLGVRFINQIAEATPQVLADYLREPPICPSNLPLLEFIYQSTFDVPGYPFNVRVIKIMQRSMPELTGSAGLFLDIDVFSTTAIPNESGALASSLERMRWLKNKVFFTLITEEAVRAFGGGAHG